MRRWDRMVMDLALRDLDAAHEVLDSWRRMAVRFPAREPGLTVVLANYAERLAAAGRYEESLAVIDEAGAICRRRAADEPDRFEPRLAELQLMRGKIHRRTSRHRQAVVAVRESVEPWQRVLPRDRRRFEPMLADAMDVLVRALSDTGGWAEAASVAEELVEIRRRRAVDEPAAVEPDLAATLSLLAGCLLEMGRLEDGWHAGGEAIEVLRRLAHRDPQRYAPLLAKAIRDREHDLDVLTRRVAARAAADEVVLGPFPLCEECRRTNGGLVAVSHPQVHVRSHGKQACVDEALAEIITSLWAVCDTVSCCQDDGGRAYVIPAPGNVTAAENLLTTLGIDVDNQQGVLHFATPTIAGGAMTKARSPDVGFRACDLRKLVGGPDGI